MRSSSGRSLEPVSCATGIYLQPQEGETLVMAAKLFFESLKEYRGEYFVEYQPPVSANQFANLALVFHEDQIPDYLSDIMAQELEYWLAKYPVPIMISAGDATDSLVKPKESDADSFLVGWLDPKTKAVVSSWKLDDLTKFNEDHPFRGDWRSVYTDVPCRTQEQVTAQANESLQTQRRHVLALKGFLILWLAVIPASWALIQFLGPLWLGLLVVLYSLYQAIQKWREIMGLRRPSAREAEKAEKQRKMEHYYYHCERNPIGFAGLKAENLEKEIREETRKEAANLARTSKKNVEP
jgi:hypothetical protein